MTAFAVTTAPSDGTAFDGRHARRVRNRDAVITAMVEFLGEGEPRPTAQMVAERSGVSLRSVFRYFAHLDELFAVAIERYHERDGEGLVFRQPLPGTTLDERVEAWVEHRVVRCGAVARTWVTLYGRRDEDAAISAAIERARTVSVRAVEQLFAPELAHLAARERAMAVAALHSATSIEAWRNLVDAHGLDADGQRHAFRKLVRGALRTTGLEAAR
jgi:AcrR family transcriptional regulator